VATRERILRLHLLPKRPQETQRHHQRDVALLKADLGKCNPKTVNNVVNVLSKLLKVAVEWGVIERMRCTIKLLKTVTPIMTFYEESDFARLVEAARKVDPRVQLMVLLGGDAGLRRGEIISLRQCDVDARRRQLHVRFATWYGVEDVPKGGRGRIIPMTEALASALAATGTCGVPVSCTRTTASRSTRTCCSSGWSRRPSGPAYRSPGPSTSFATPSARGWRCEGPPAKAIQELAGHANLSTTLRYMHRRARAPSGCSTGPSQGTSVETLWRRFRRQRRKPRDLGLSGFRRRDSNPNKRIQSPLSCHWTTPEAVAGCRNRGLNATRGGSGARGARAGNERIGGVALRVDRAAVELSGQVASYRRGRHRQRDGEEGQESDDEDHGCHADATRQRSRQGGVPPVNHESSAC
jgi:integrase